MRRCLHQAQDALSPLVPTVDAQLEPPIAPPMDSNIEMTDSEDDDCTLLAVKDNCKETNKAWSEIIAYNERQ